MSVSSVSSNSNATSSATGKTNNATHQSNFMTLLIAQLRNQDPLNPTTNEDFIAQLAQLESLDETKKISNSLSTMVSSQDFSSASTLIGKTVSGITNSDSGSPIHFRGVVNSVVNENGKVNVKLTDIEGNVYSVAMNDITEISQ